MEWDTTPTLPTCATGVPLARQPQPPLSPPPSRPSTPKVPSPIRRVDGPDYGRRNDTVKFPANFSPVPFGDLEPSTTNENEKIPSLSTSTQINELVSHLQIAIDKLDTNVKSIISKPDKLREVTESKKLLQQLIYRKWC